MKVKKGSQQLRKGSRINRKRLRTLFFAYDFSVKPLRFPFGVQRLSLYTTRREAPSSKKEIIFVGNIYFRIHLKVYLLSNQKLFLLYVNYIREISSYM